MVSGGDGLWWAWAILMVGWVTAIGLMGLGLGRLLRGERLLRKAGLNRVYRPSFPALPASLY